MAIIRTSRALAKRSGGYSLGTTTNVSLSPPFSETATGKSLLLRVCFTGHYTLTFDSRLIVFDVERA